MKIWQSLTLFLGLFGLVCCVGSVKDTGDTDTNVDTDADSDTDVEYDLLADPARQGSGWCVIDQGIPGLGTNLPSDDTWCRNITAGTCTNYSVVDHSLSTPDCNAARISLTFINGSMTALYGFAAHFDGVPEFGQCEATPVLYTMNANGYLIEGRLWHISQDYGNFIEMDVEDFGKFTMFSDIPCEPGI